MSLSYCPTCERKSLYFSDVAGRWRCNKCNAIFTKDMVFVCYDPELKITIRYKKDGSIKSITPPTENMNLYNEVINRQHETIDFKWRLNNAWSWWNNLTDKEQIDIYEKNK